MNDGGVVSGNRVFYALTGVVPKGTCVTIKVDVDASLFTDKETVAELEKKPREIQVYRPSLAMLILHDFIS